MTKRAGGITVKKIPAALRVPEKKCSSHLVTKAPEVTGGVLSRVTPGDPECKPPTLPGQCHLFRVSYKTKRRATPILLYLASGNSKAMRRKEQRRSPSSKQP